MNKELYLPNADPNLAELQKTVADIFTGDVVQKVTLLAGQASSRRYYRLSSKRGASYLLMQLPPGGDRSASEEIVKKGEVSRELPFVAVQRYLHRIGIAVPELYAYLENEGQLLLEDLGDLSLEKLVSNASQELVIFYYKKAIELLLALQEKTTHARDPKLIAFERSFDFDLLYWECEHFIEYGIQDFDNCSLPQAKRDLLHREFKRLCEELCALPYCFVHRDFQSRNLHLHAYEFKCIDFQDALQGPFVYDLVALLRDSYIVLENDCLQQLLDFYWQGIQKNGMAAQWSLDRPGFDRAFHLQTLQRKLKDTGRFQYISTVKKNDNFLPYRVPSLHYVQTSLLALPDYDALRACLDPWIAT